MCMHGLVALDMFDVIHMCKHVMCVCEVEHITQYASSIYLECLLIVISGVLPHELFTFWNQ